MAKKELGNISAKDKNLGGVNALFAPAVGTKSEVQNNHDEARYSLILPTWLKKNLELRRVETGVSIKDQITEALIKHYKL